MSTWESQEIKAKIINNYDCIFDLNDEDNEEKQLERLENIEEFLLKIQFKIKSFILNLQNKKTKKVENKNDFDYWENLLNKYLFEEEELNIKNWKKLVKVEYKNWIKELNLKWLLEFLDENNNKKYSTEKAIEYFKQKMRKGSVLFLI